MCTKIRTGRSGSKYKEVSLGFYFLNEECTERDGRRHEKYEEKKVWSHFKKWKSE